VDQDGGHEPAVLGVLAPVLFDAGGELRDRVAGTGGVVLAAGDLPLPFVAQPAARTEVPAQRTSGAHLDEFRQVVIVDADGVGGAGRDAGATLDTPVLLDDGLVEFHEPGLLVGRLDVVHLRADLVGGGVEFQSLLARPLDPHVGGCLL